MELTREQKHLLLQFQWKLGMNASESAEKINEAYGDGTISRSGAKGWFAKFRNGEENLEDQPRSGRPPKLDGVEVLPHPAYSPDCAPSDYGLFRSMQHFLKGRKFESFEEVEQACQEFFDSKEPAWYFEQIRKLADRWQKVVNNDGLYFEE